MNFLRCWIREERRAWRRFLRTYRYSPVAVRLARFQAYRRNGEGVYVTRVEPLDGDACVVRAADIHGGVVFVFVDDYRRVIYGNMKLQYRANPASAMLAFFGRSEYQMRPDTYLTVVGE